MRRDARFWALAAVACAALSGCALPEPGWESVPVGPMDAFARDVEPVLERRCAQGSCHGRPERGLALFAPGVLRADATRTYLDEPLDARELAGNALRLAAFADRTSAERSLALRAPLATSAGGIAHGGGDVFADASDPGYRALLAWLRLCVPPADGGPP